MAKRTTIEVKTAQDYNEFLKKVGRGEIDGVAVTHDGYPLSLQEAKFIDLFVATGKLRQSLQSSNLKFRDIGGKDYIVSEINWRLDQLKKQSIADADEILQYFTKVMRGEEKDQFGLDAPLCERTAAAKELAKRIIDVAQVSENANPEVRITLDCSGLFE